MPEEATSVSLDNTEDRWWDQTELTKLILASNWLTALSDDIRNFSALTVLDVSQCDLPLQKFPFPVCYKSHKGTDVILKFTIYRAHVYKIQGFQCGS